MSHNVKVGTTLRLYFMVFDGGAGKTGLTDGDFMKELHKDGTTTQASTGITISEVDSANFPGRYVATCSGSTSFMATTADYDLLFYWSSQTSDDGFATSLTVTTDGTGAGSWGDAAFTATSGDGRVTDGANPIEAATIRILDPNGVLWVQTITDASGVYGPVYFEQDGTFTVSVQKSGYMTASYSIVVSGATATGPGSDATITLSSSSTGLTFADLKSYTLRQWFDKSDTQAETVAGEVVNEAAEMIASEKRWSWYDRMLTIDLVAPYSTGTIAITEGSATVTGTGTVFPSWAASGVIIYNGQVYTVLSRDSDTQLTLDQNWPIANITGAGYVLARYSYTLPSNILVVDAAMLGSGWPSGAVYTSHRNILLRRDQYQNGSGPTEYSFWKDQFIIWPYSNEARRLNISVHVKPAELVSDNDELDWNPNHKNLLHRAIDAVLTTRGKTLAGSQGQAWQIYKTALARAMQNDRSPGRVDINRRTGVGINALQIDMANRSVSTS